MKIQAKAALAAGLLFVITTFLMIAACSNLGAAHSSPPPSARATASSVEARPQDVFGLPATPVATEFVGRTPVREAASPEPAPPMRGGQAPDELLVIERRKAAEKANASTLAERTALGTGGLVCEVEGKHVTVPLKHTDVKASVTGYISAVSVTQQFHNPFDGKIEVVYVFPLPENAAVSDFLMTIGDRTIRGIIREREDAQRIYNHARAQGYTASLLTQERPNVFTQKVANIEPGKAIDINITYYNTLAYSDGGFEFVFPMVVGPRFNPADLPPDSGIGAVARDNPGASGQKVEVQYLRPEERSGHDIALTIDIDAGVSIEAIECRTHKTNVQRTGPSRATVTLAPDDRIPNRDFVLRWTVVGDAVKSAILAHPESGCFTMMLVPPRDSARVPRNAVELVFVLDSSGSMSGRPIEQAQHAISRGLDRLQPGDSFQIIDFSNDVSTLGSAPLPATSENIKKARKHLAKLNAEGGTHMMKGLRAALDFPHDPERLRFVVFCTDGYIGNEAEILGTLHTRLGASRVFSFGVGPAVNRYLMDSMARMGNGFATYLNLSDDAATVMDAFFDRISHAPLSDIQIDWRGAEVSEVFPSRVPDLFAERPVIITGRFTGPLPSSVLVSGRVGTERRDLSVSVTTTNDPLASKALAQVWARTKLTHLADQFVWDIRNQAELMQAAKRTALDYNLMSDFTAFVAVDSSVRTTGEYGTTVQVPVPMPQGVRYETTVQEPGR